MSVMKKYLLHVFLLIVTMGTLSAQEGAPLLSHFRESSDIENQSWAICQDGNNVMMFANRRGIMTFDGQNWSFIRTPSVPYSLEFNRDNKRIYAGCDNNYGYLEKDNKGLYNYVSLVTDSAEVGIIGKIIFTDTTVTYYSELSVSRHNIKTGQLECRLTSKENEPFTGITITPKNTFVNVMSKGLFRVEADTLFPIVTGYLLKDEEVLFSLPYDNKFVLLGFDNGSLSLFDGLKFYDYQIKDEGYLKQNMLSDGISISDSLYAFSTLDGGAIVVERKSGKLITAVNYQNGLPDDEVFAIGSDNTNGLWLSHQYGLSRVDLRLPVGNFSIYPGIKGNLITSVWHNNELFVATSEGVFYLEEIKNYSQVEIIVKDEKKKSNLSLPSTISSNTQVPQTQPTQETQKTKKGLLTRIFGRKLTAPAGEKPSAQEKSITQENTINKEKSITKEKRADRISKRRQNKVTEPQYVKKTISRLKSINYSFRKVEGLNEKCKQLVSTPSGILASTNMGLFYISGHTAKAIVKDIYINYIDQKTNNNRYYIATSDGFFYVTAVSGNWTVIFPDRNFVQPLYSITYINNETLWAGGNSIAYKITKRKENADWIYKTYAVKNDYPNKYIVENINDTIFLITESGFSYYDEGKDTFNEYKRDGVKNGSKVNIIISQPEVPWFKEGDEWIYMPADNKVAGNDKALLKIFDDIISINLSRNYIWVVTGNNQLFRIVSGKSLTIKPDIDLYVKSVTNEDGIKFDLTDIVFKRGDNSVFFDLAAPGYLKQNSTQYQYFLEKMMTDWSKWSSASTIALMPPPGSYNLKVRAKDIWGNVSEPTTLKFTIKAPFTQTTLFYIIVTLIIIYIVLLVIRFREAQLRKDKKILEQKVKERTAEIAAQKEEITSSIEYASRIQMAMLPINDHYTDFFSDHFVIFKPRDIVSGDFYWIGEDDHHIFFTVADCTGHGVPGAFMSTLGISTLNEIIANKSDLKANTILDLLREKIKTSLHQTGKEGEASDGMDIAFCVLDKNRKVLEFSGAYNPLLIFQGGEMKEYKADRMPIGIYYGEKKSFTNYEISVKKGDTLYIFSDGFVDQFGGPDGVKYKLSKLKLLLSGIYYKPLDEQRSIIENEFQEWRGAGNQIDDVTIIGVRI